MASGQVAPGFFHVAEGSTVFNTGGGFGVPYTATLRGEISISLDHSDGSTEILYDVSKKHATVSRTGRCAHSARRRWAIRGANQGATNRHAWLEEPPNVLEYSSLLMEILR